MIILILRLGVALDVCRCVITAHVTLPDVITRFNAARSIFQYFTLYAPSPFIRSWIYMYLFLGIKET